MAISKADVGASPSMKVIELFREFYHSVTSVGTTATAVPATPLTGRKAIVIQNGHASNSIYIGYAKPYVIKGNASFMNSIDMKHDGSSGDDNQLMWQASGSGTNEYYLTTLSGGNPGLSETLRMYGITASGGTFGLVTNGTAGSLNNLEWDWADNDSLGFSTVYFRCNAGDPDAQSWLTLLSYTRMPTADTTATGGFKVTAGNSSPMMCLDSTVLVFVIASGASTPVVALEFA